tara:strand:+ start:320 stop:1225 length:906 start_codon:yes stop_codon:yes gene_type:complete
MKNYYDILNVDENANDITIKKAWRKLQMKYHPDKGGDPEKAKEINEAYECLSNPDKRRRYNMSRNGGGIPFGMAHGGMPNGMDNLFNMFFNNDNDPFRSHVFSNMGGGGSPNIQVFHNGKRVNINRKPPEINKSLTIKLEDSYNGVSIPITIERWIQTNNTRTTENETLYIPIHMGIDNNEIIVLKNKGNVLNNVNGDIKVHIKIKNETTFIRKGMDLIYRKKLSLKEALTGFSFEIKHLNGKILNINNSGDYIIEPNNHQLVNKYGMKRDNKVGNMIIEFNIEFPKSLTNEQKNKLKDIL